MAKVSCRKAFSDTLLKAARTDKNIYTVATDSRGSVTTSQFFRELPDQSVELGIAEQNAVAFGAGLALTGKNVFVTSPACFLAARSYEQVKVDVAYNNTNVKLIGVSAGVSYGPLGCTHTSLHDFASMRSLPNIHVYAPADGVQTAWLIQQMTSWNGPAYIRMGRGDVEAVYPEGTIFEPGKAKTVVNGSDVTIIACGEMVYYAVQAAKLLEEEGISARVLDLFCLKPFDEEPIIRAAQETKAIVTVEEHSINGGLGELVSHVVVENCPRKMAILGFPDEEYVVGKSNELFKHYGLTPENIAASAKRLLR